MQDLGIVGVSGLAGLLGLLPRDSGCTAMRVDGGVEIKCGRNDPVMLRDGTCSATRVDGGVQITCDGGDEYLLKDAACTTKTVTTETETYAEIVCGDTVSKVKGIKGDTGDRGEQGKTGQRGPQGNPGAPGQQGPEGDGTGHMVDGYCEFTIRYSATNELSRRTTHVVPRGELVSVAVPGKFTGENGKVTVTFSSSEPSHLSQCCSSRVMYMASTGKFDHVGEFDCSSYKEWDISGPTTLRLVSAYYDDAFDQVAPKNYF